MSLMPKCSCTQSQCLVYMVVHFVWNMMKHLPHMSTFHLQYLCFVFVLQQAHFSWWARADRGGPVCQWISSRSMHWDAAKPVRHPRDSRWGPLARNALSIMWQMARSLFLFSFLCEPVARLAECNNPSNKCTDGPQTFVWTNGRICWCSGEYDQPCP